MPDKRKRTTRGTTRRTTVNHKKRRKSPKPPKQRFGLLIFVFIIILVFVLIIGIRHVIKYRTYSGYEVKAEYEIGNSDVNTKVFAYKDGYIRCDSSSVTYFDTSGILWDESCSTTTPIVDHSGDYIAVADSKQRSAYLFNESGYVNKITFSHPITDIEVSSVGTIAVSTKERNADYIEICDQYGDEILTSKSIFSSNGYIMDIAMSDDGTKMAAVFVSIVNAQLKSKVVLYDLENGSSEDVSTTEYADYGTTLLTTAHFMDNDTVFVIGDDAMSIYSFDEENPVVMDVRDIEWEVQSLFFEKSYAGIIVEQNGSEDPYCIKVYDKDGRQLMDMGTSYSYSKIDFAGDNVIMYSYSDCVIYSFEKIMRYSGSFEDHIELLKSDDGVNFVYGTNEKTSIITLKK